METLMIVQFKYDDHVKYPYHGRSENNWFKAWNVSKDKEYLVIKVSATDIYTIVDDNGNESSFHSRHFKDVVDLRDQRLNKLL